MARYICCLYVPEFSFAALPADKYNPALPAVMVTSTGAGDTVAETNIAGHTIGISDGMPVSRACGMHEDIQLFEQDPGRADLTMNEMLTLCEAIGLPVDPVRPGEILTDLSTVEKLYGGLKGALATVGETFAEIDSMQIGLAATPLLAQIAARSGAPRHAHIIAPEHGADVVAQTPLAELPIEVDDKLMTTLSMLGIDTCGDLSSLEESAVVDRFGEAGRRLWRQAAGVGDEGITAREALADISVSMEFPDGSENQYAWVAAMSKLLGDLLATDEMHGFDLRAIVVSGQLITGSTFTRTVRFREPTRDIQVMVNASRPALQEIPEPLHALTVHVDHRTPTGADQLDLDHKRARPRDVAMQQTMQHIAATLGPEMVREVVTVDRSSRVPEKRDVLVARIGHQEADHLRSSGQRTQADPFTRVNTPQPVRVITGEDGRPRRIREKTKAPLHEIVHIQEAWKLDDDWWTDQPLRRSYYECLLDNGHVACIFFDHIVEGWYTQHA